MFYRLLVNCDDYGRMDARPEIVRARCFPLRLDRVSNDDVTAWLNALEGAGLIQLYTVAGKRYLQVVTWAKHQQVRAARSKYPAPDSADQQTDSNDAQPQASDCNSLSSDINCNQLQSDDSKCPRNPNPNPNPKRNNTPHPADAALSEFCEIMGIGDEKERNKLIAFIRGVHKNYADVLDDALLELSNAVAAGEIRDIKHARSSLLFRVKKLAKEKASGPGQQPSTAEMSEEDAAVDGFYRYLELQTQENLKQRRGADTGG